jgi:hypothetical protein
MILQDRAGGAVLTTADSGATIANATLNSPTLVTPALGTPASGTLTNCTFPAGHVIQTVGDTDNTYRTGGTNAGPLEGVRKAIVSTVANSNYYISGGSPSWVSSAHGAVGIFLNGITLSDLIFTTSNADNTGTNQGWHGSRVSYNSDSSYRLENTISYFYDPGTVSAGTTLTFYIGVMGYYSGSATIKVNDNTSPTYAQSNITIMEIAP